MVAQALYLVGQSSANFALGMSQATWQEFLEVVYRPKFNRYLTAAQRVMFVKEIEALACWPDVGESVDACRDPTDNKFLEVALAGQAEAVITGDKDLLVLHPWRNIQIISPSQFVHNHSI